MLMYLPGTLTKPQESMLTSSAITWMLTQQSLLESNHLGAHPKTIMKLLRMRWLNLSKQGLSRSILSRMVSQHCGSKKEERKVVSVHRLHRLEQSLSERSFPSSSDRPVGGRNGRPSSDEFPGRPPRIPLNTIGFRRSGENIFCHSHWELPL